MPDLMWYDLYDSGLGVSEVVDDAIEQWGDEDPLFASVYGFAVRGE